jgi:hypothetical protein
MLIFLGTLLATLYSTLRSRTALELANLALRHQVGVLQRSAREREKLTHLTVCSGPDCLCVSNWEFSRRIQDCATLRGARRLTYADPHMRDLLLALLHLAVVTAKLCGSGGVRAVMAENLLLKQQLIVLRRARKRAPNLTPSDRLLCGFC